MLRMVNQHVHPNGCQNQVHSQCDRGYRRGYLAPITVRGTASALGYPWARSKAIACVELLCYVNSHATHATYKAIAQAHALPANAMQQVQRSNSRRHRMGRPVRHLRPNLRRLEALRLSQQQVRLSRDCRARAVARASPAAWRSARRRGCVTDTAAQASPMPRG
jgi:hypothetical protein